VLCNSDFEEANVGINPSEQSHTLGIKIGNHIYEILIAQDITP
jgi:hypothetical protein